MSLLKGWWAETDLGLRQKQTQHVLPLEMMELLWVDKVLQNSGSVQYSIVWQVISQTMISYSVFIELRIFWEIPSVAAQGIA